MITRFILFAGFLFASLGAIAQNHNGPMVVSVVAKELRIYDAPDPQSLPRGTVSAGNVPLPAPVIEKNGVFLRAVFGGQAVWIKSGEVRLSQPVDIASGCASNTAHTGQNRSVVATTNVGGTRGIENACN